MMKSNLEGTVWSPIGVAKPDLSDLVRRGWDFKSTFKRFSTYCKSHPGKVNKLTCFLIGVFICFAVSLKVMGEAHPSAAEQKITIEWQNCQPKGTIEVLNGDLLRIDISKGKGKINGNSYGFRQKGAAGMTVTIGNIHNNPGSDPTIVRVRNCDHPFSFFLRDINKDFPVFIPEFQVAVTTAEDARPFEQIETALKNKNLKTKLQQIEVEPEESFDSASIHTRNQPCPTWLGISRDMRIFELTDNRTHPASEMNIIRPRDSSTPVKIQESGEKILEYGYLIGRGQGVTINTTRRLEEGVLPILHSTLIDEDIEYYSTAFVTLEKSPLTIHTPIGTDFLVADQFSG